MTHIDRVVFTNPERGKMPDYFTDAELEVTRMAEQDTQQQAVEYVAVVREYWAPFNYPNFCVELGRTDPYVGAEFNEDGVELDEAPYGAITFVEDAPIIGVEVIGSACVPPGFVQIYAEPVVWKYPRTGIKMKVDNLWGEHLRLELIKAGLNEGWRTAGLSSAHFSLPQSKKVTIMTGSQHDMADLDMHNMRHDAHYCTRIIRVTVQKPLV
jgi:hypothetical protein